MEKFRIAAKNLFLTYPRCSEAPHMVRDRIVHELKQDIAFLIVAHEKHKDEAPEAAVEDHLHVVISLIRRREFRGKKWMEIFDHFAGQHGNYKACISLKASLKYVMKEGDYLLHPHDFDLDSVLVGKTGKAKICSQMIISGASLQELEQWDSGYVLQNLKKIKDYQFERLNWPENREYEKWKPIDLEQVAGEENLKIAQWLNDNILVDRPFKAKQLFLYGQANTGKTTLVRNLEKYLRIYWAPEGKWMDGFDDNYDLVIFDEFYGSKTLSWMNMFLQGSPVTVEVKGGFVKKTRNIPVIITSNKAIGEIYSKAHYRKLDALESRLECIKVEELINVF